MKQLTLMTKLFTSLLLIVCLCFSKAWAIEPGFALIHANEYQQELAAQHEHLSRFLGIGGISEPPPDHAPSIVLVNPDISIEITSPIDIELRFESTSRDIDMNSLKILYGLLKLDITDRIKEKADITNNHLIAKDAKLPTGSHRLRVEISDSAGVTGWKYFQIEIK